MVAANFTTQVRAIAEVATAVTKGDLTRSSQVEAQGEVAELKDNVNKMIHNLRHTTNQNTEQDWLKTNLARFTNMLQGQRDLATVGRMLLSEMAPLINAQNGVIYLVQDDPGPRLKLLSAYADASDDGRHPVRMAVGDGLIGQCAADGRRVLITDVPNNVVPIRSGMFKVMPTNIIVLPVLFEGQVKAVFEFASVERFHAITGRIPRSTYSQHRHRAEQHRSDDADRRPVAAIAEARERAAIPAARIAADQRTA